MGKSICTCSCVPLSFPLYLYMCAQIIGGERELFNSQVVDVCSKFNSQCKDIDLEQNGAPHSSAGNGGHCRVEDASQSLEHQRNQKISSDNSSMPTSDVSGIQKIIPSGNDVSMFTGFSHELIF